MSNSSKYEHHSLTKLLNFIDNIKETDELWYINYFNINLAKPTYTNIEGTWHIYSIEFRTDINKSYNELNYIRCYNEIHSYSVKSVYNNDISYKIKINKYPNPNFTIDKETGSLIFKDDDDELKDNKISNWFRFIDILKEIIEKLFKYKLVTINKEILKDPIYIDKLKKGDVFYDAEVKNKLKADYKKKYLEIVSYVKSIEVNNKISYKYVSNEHPLFGELKPNPTSTINIKDTKIKDGTYFAQFYDKDIKLNSYSNNNNENIITYKKYDIVDFIELEDIITSGSSIDMVIKLDISIVRDIYYIIPSIYKAFISTAQKNNIDGLPEEVSELQI